MNLPLNDCFQIDVAGLPDLDQVKAMATTCVDGPHWPGATWSGYLEARSEQGRQGVLLVARTSDGQLVGWLAGSLVAGAAELDFLLVEAGWRGQGLARRLLRKWIDWLQIHGAQDASLEVRASNHVALRLYRSTGFATVGCRRDYYRHPLEDAIVLHRTLAEGECKGTPP